MQKTRIAAVVLTLIATITATVMRIILTPGMQDEDTGAFHISYVIICILLVAMLGIALLVFLSKGSYVSAIQLDRNTGNMLAAASVFSGLVLGVSSLFDVWQWMCFDITPPPNDSVINKLDGVTLFLTLLFGILGGIYLIMLGVSLISGKLKRSSKLSFSALLPVFWIWVRLVRYEVSYSSAIQVSQSFYDFVMLIFTMLFLFAFARYISGTGERSPRMLLIFALCTVLLSVSGPLTSIAMYVSGETEAYNSSRLAGFTDFGMGILAIFAAIALVFSKRQEVLSEPVSVTDPMYPNDQMIREEPPADPSEPEYNPTADEILDEYVSKGEAEE